MPIFEYNCPEHGKFEELITRQCDIIAVVNGDMEVVCPKCGKTAERLVSAVNQRWGIGQKPTQKFYNK